MKELRSGGGARWRACVGVLAASAVVLLMVGGDVAADMPRLTETPWSLGRKAGVSEKTSSAADEMGFLGAGADAGRFS